MPDRYAHIDFAPTPAAREAARRALAAEGAADLAPVASARLRALAAGRRLVPAVVRRMAVGDDALAVWAARVVAQMDVADRVVEAAKPPVGDDPGVAVVLCIDAETAEFAFGDAAAEAHITLAYLGRCSALPGGALSLARSVVAAWATQVPAMPARFSGVGRFHGDDGETDAVYLSVDAPGLTAARDALCRMLRAAGFAVATNHGFTPHATVCYVPRSAPTPEAPVDLPLALRLDCAAVWCGGDHGAAVMLSGVGDPALMADAPPAGDEPKAVTFRGESAEIVCRDAVGVGNRTLNQIGRYGDFKGHHQGPFKIDAKVFAEVKRNFDATLNRRVRVDYEHMSEILPDGVALHGAPAVAWVVGLDIRPDGTLWAEFEWVDPVAVEHVRAKRYLYLSPAITFDARDKVTARPIGARLTSVGLTNNPFLDGMAPVTASDTTGHTMEVQTPEVAVAADLPKMAPSAAPAEAAADASKDKAEKEGASPDGKRDGYGKFASDIAMACGLTDFSADSEGAEDILITRVRGIADQLAAIQERERAAAVTDSATMADRVIAAKRAPAAAKERLAKLCLSDRETFDALHPLAEIEAAEKSVRMSDAAPPAVAPIAAPPVHTATPLGTAGVMLTPTAPPPDAATARLLTTHVTADKPPPAAQPEGESAADLSTRRAALAARLLSEGKAKNETEALYAADKELHRQRRADAVRPFAGN